jgi:hypothetical protein
MKIQSSKLNTLKFLSLTAILFTGNNCKVPHEESASLDSSNESNDLADLRWLEKASRALRLGQGLIPDDPLRSALNEPKSAAVDALMEDPRFFATMMDFYSFYYGFKTESGVKKSFPISQVLYNPKTKILRTTDFTKCQLDPTCVRYDTSFDVEFQISGHPAILSAATAVVDGKSLDVLYHPSQPSYISVRSLQDLVVSLIFASQPPSKRNANSASNLDPVNLSELSKKATQGLNKLSQLVNSHIAKYSETPGNKVPLANNFCKDALKLTGDLEAVFSLGSIIDLSFAAVCSQSTDPSLTELKHMRDRLIVGQKSLAEVFLFLEDYLTKKLKISHGTYFDASSYLKTAPKNQLFDQTFWNNHPNSSTNYNRRRAAYVFKTFFCDDLTPVKLEIAKDANDNRHASDPSCMACHYKLDPLAGFFRGYGIGGIKMDVSDSMVFDDQKQISGKELQKYRASWDFPGTKGPNQGQNIGLVRSSTDLSKNSYGTTLDDLGKLIALDPRTYTCKAQRLADYFIGGGQTYDRGWLEEIALAMSSAPKSANGQSVKYAIKKVLLSKAFSTQNPTEGICYDQATSSKKSSKIDCRVASTISKYCAKCHGPNGDNGGLNLVEWEEKFGFKHLDDNGNQIPIKKSYQRILERLGPSDQGPIMPLNSPMPDPDRHLIRKWFEEQIQKSK